MNENQRMSPSLSEKLCLQQASVRKQAGFSLIELMVVIAILGFLMTIGNGAWSQYRESTRVDSAKEKVVSILQQARLKALSSGTNQMVTLGYSTEKVTDILGRQVTFENVNLEYFVCGTCTATNPPDKTLIFKRGGTVAGTASAKNIRVSSPATGKSYIVMVNNVTGRVDVRTQCSVSHNPTKCYD
jgi:prepilin-type N-terminal cleavage/methylation domain-containing protein